MIRKITDIGSPFDMTDEELDHYSEEEIGNMPCDIQMLPFWTRARYLAKQSKNRVRAYLQDWKYGVDFTNFEQPRYADNAVMITVSDELLEKLKGDNWEEQVRLILSKN